MTKIFYVFFLCECEGQDANCKKPHGRTPAEEKFFELNAVFKKSAISRQ